MQLKMFMTYNIRNEISILEARTVYTGRFLIKDRSDDALNVSRN